MGTSYNDVYDEEESVITLDYLEILGKMDYEITYLVKKQQNLCFVAFLLILIGIRLIFPFLFLQRKFVVNPDHI